MFNLRLKWDNFKIHDKFHGKAPQKSAKHKNQDQKAKCLLSVIYLFIDRFVDRCLLLVSR